MTRDLKSLQRRLPGLPEVLHLDGFEQTIGWRFEEQVQKYPRATAISLDGQLLTYSELNARANRLANSIIDRRGAGAEAVPYLVSGWLNAIVAILAIAKTGKFFVSLNAGQPASFVQHLLADCDARLIVVDQASEETVQALFGETAAQPPRIINMDLPGAAAETNPNVVVAPDDLFSLNYTSGSTGRPKGVLRTHRGRLRSVRENRSTFGFSTHDRVSMLLDPSAGMGRSDLLAALLNGATLCPFDARRRGLAHFGRWCREEQITVLRGVPSLMRGLARHLPTGEKLPSLRLVGLGGELVHWDDIAQIKKHLDPSCHIVNWYGSTEVGFSTWHLADSASTTSGGIVPVGYPADDISILLLDDQGREVPFGEEGEIVIQCRTITPGYWKHPQLTAEKIKPAADGSGEMQYFSGDLGKFAADSQLILLGRKGSFIKLFGFRIEPGAIEVALRSLPAIEDAVVDVRADANKSALLAAYLILAPGAAINASELRRELAQSLPEHMIPGRFITVEQFPITHTGKVDRLALPDPDAQRPALVDAYQPPTSQIERELAALWAEILGIDQIGLDDDFFDLGGNSLLGAELMARINTQFALDLPITTLIDCPTIAQMATRLKRPSAPAEENNYAVPFQTAGERLPFFAIHGSGSTVIDYVFLARTMKADQPFYAIQRKGYNGEAAADETIQEMATHCIEVMRSVQPSGPYHFGGYCFGGIIAYEMAQQLAAAGEEVGLIAIMEGSTPTDLQEPRSFLNGDRLAAIWRSCPVWIQDYGEMGVQKAKSAIRPRGSTAVPVQRQDVHAAALPDVNKIVYTNRSDQLEHVQRILDLDDRAMHTYIPQAYPGKVTLFRAQVQSLNKTFFGPLDPTLGWGSFAASVDSIPVAGVHRKIHLPPYVPSLAAALQEALERTATVQAAQLHGQTTTSEVG